MGVMAVGVLEALKVADPFFFTIFFFFLETTLYLYQGQQRTSNTRRSRWDNILVQSYTPSASIQRKNNLDSRNLGMGEVSKFYEPALNKAGSFDRLWVWEMALDNGCLEGRFWPSISSLEHVRDLKRNQVLVFIHV